MKHNVYDPVTKQTFLLVTWKGRVTKFESLIKVEAKRRAKRVRLELERLIMEEK